MLVLSSTKAVVTASQPMCLSLSYWSSCKVAKLEQIYASTDLLASVPSNTVEFRAVVVHSMGTYFSDSSHPVHRTGWPGPRALQFFQHAKWPPRAGSSPMVSLL